MQADSQLYVLKKKPAERIMYLCAKKQTRREEEIMAVDT